ncbi:MAG: ABC transporter substrate-binding protein [Eubacteriales bacterium]|nr:ABC transporter substrate-binding protein [Eubacteriales bacterium]
MKKKIAVMAIAGVLAAGTLTLPVLAKGDDTYEVIMQWPAVGDAPAGLADVEAKANEMLEEIGVTLVLEPVNAFNLGTETSLAVSSGQKLDLSVSLFTGIGSLVNNGSIIELDELLAEYGQDILEICSEAQMTGGLYDGETYAVPLAYIDGNDVGLVCRKDVLDEAGIEVDPDKYYTFDELEEIFAQVKAVKGDNFYMIAGGLGSTGFPFGAQYCTDVCGQSAASGVIMISDENPDSTTIVNMYATDEYKEYADRMYAWNQAGYFSPDASTDNESSTVLIAGGNYLGTFQNYTGTDTLVDYKTNTGYEGVCLKTLPAVSRSNEYTSVLWSIPSTCDNPEKTMEFLNYLYKNSDLANLLRYGLEGVTYEIVESDENGTVVQFVDGVDSMTAPYYQQFGIYGNRLEWYVMYPNTTTANKELKEFSDQITRRSPVLGYTFNVDSVSAKYSAVDAVIQQYGQIINSGSIDPEKELPEFLAALETAGINEVIAENQSQLDAWLAEQN